MRFEEEKNVYTLFLKIRLTFLIFSQLSLYYFHSPTFTSHFHFPSPLFPNPPSKHHLPKPLPKSSLSYLSNPHPIHPHNHHHHHFSFLISSPLYLSVFYHYHCHSTNPSFSLLVFFFPPVLKLTGVWVRSGSSV